MTFQDVMIDETSKNVLAAKIAELEMTKESLKGAKDDAMQLYLDSRPLTDELEKMQAEVALAKARVVKANSVISELQAQLGTIDMCIKSSMEEELKFRTTIDDKNQALDRIQEEMEQSKRKIDEKRRRISKLKQILRFKRQTLLTMQLTYDALQLESHAFSTPAARALNYINNSEARDVTIQLNLEDYKKLKRTAGEQISLAEKRISVAIEEKLAAENNRDSAFRRLQQLYCHSESSKRKLDEERIHHHNIREKIDIQYASTGGRGEGNYIEHVFSKPQMKLPIEASQSNPDRQFKSSKRGYLVKKNKLSIFIRIRTFFARKLRKCFR